MLALLPLTATVLTVPVLAGCEPPAAPADLERAAGALAGQRFRVGVAAPRRIADAARTVGGTPARRSAAWLATGCDDAWGAGGEVRFELQVEIGVPADRATPFDDLEARLEATGAEVSRDRLTLRFTEDGIDYTLRPAGGFIAAVARGEECLARPDELIGFTHALLPR